MRSLSQHPTPRRRWLAPRFRWSVPAVLTAPAAIVVALLPGACRGQESHPDRDSSTAREAGAFRERVALATREFLEQTGAPGVVVSWIRDGGEPVTVAKGRAGGNAGDAAVPMEPGTRFLAGSVGKTFVAATVLSLVAEGRIGLDQPISRWLGDSEWFPGLPNGDEISVRMLLSHTSGLPDHVGLPAFAESASARWAADANFAFTPEELVGFILDRGPLFEPGAGYAYSDANYILLGLVIERVTGRGFYDVLAERFLEPLELGNTTPATSRRISGLATGHNPRGLFGLPEVMVRDGALAVSPANEWTGGGLVSTAPDLARWMEALAMGRTEIGAEGYRLMREGAPADSEGAYGLGLSLGRGGGEPVEGHDGYFPGYRSRVAWFPERNLAVAVLSNLDTVDPGGLVLTVARLVTDTETDRVTSTPALPEACTIDPSAPVAGVWTGSLTVPRGSHDVRLRLEGSDDELQGTWTSQDATWRVAGRYREGTLELRTTGRPEGPGAADVEDLDGLALDGNLREGRLEGVLTPILPGRGPLPRSDLRWVVIRDGC